MIQQRTERPGRAIEMAGCPLPRWGCHPSHPSALHWTARCGLTLPRFILAVGRPVIGEGIQ